MPLSASRGRKKVKELTALDKEILNILQKEFPITVQPYGDIAAKLGIAEGELLQRIKTMKERGVIRRIGGVLDSKSLGFFSTLCACRVPEGRIDEIAAVINREKGVTHNYVRDNYYNVWFTLTAPTKRDAERKIAVIEKTTGIKILNMPALKVYKIEVCFEMGEAGAL